MREIEEGLADWEGERAVDDARSDMLYWATRVFDPCCRECGYLTYAREEHRAAIKRARALGVFDEQPGEADWLEGHRRERPLDLVEMFLSVEIGVVS